ncbi:MAG: CpsD/CapB family tyrosine-protein kinase [Chloroflexota bacterium]
MTAIEPRSAAAEAYRTLRTNLEFSSLDSPLRTIVVTSAGVNEGKSTVLANLAVALAESGKTVLVVDCDFRSPSLHTIIGGPQSPGFTDVLLGGTVDDAIHTTAISGLSLMPSGPLPPNPGEILGSNRLDKVWEDLKQRADVVLIDTPPIGLVSDAAQLAPRCDGVLLVLRAGHTRREASQNAKRQLEQVKARILGVVLNDARPSTPLERYTTKS